MIFSGCQGQIGQQVIICPTKVHEDTRHFVNEIVLIVKQYIYRQKYLGQKIQIAEVTNEIKRNYQTSLHNSQANCNTEHHDQKWSPVI